MPFPAIGEPAPWPPGLATQDGRALDLADLRGRHVLLYFYPRDDTPGCTVQACNFRDHAAELPDTVILGASIDDAPSHRAFKARFGLPFDLVVDPEHALAAAYGVLPEGAARTSRSSFLIGPDGALRRAWAKADPATHGEAVRAAIAG